MLVGAAVIVTSGALGDVLRPPRKVFLAGLAALRRLVRADRALGERRRGHRRPDDPGRGRLDDPRLRDEPALGRASGAGQMRAITLWGAASAAGAAPARWSAACSSTSTGWQGLFWIDAAIAAACIPLTLATVQESRDPNRSRSIDFAGHGADRGHPRAARARAQRGQRLGLDVGWRRSAASSISVVGAVALRHRREARGGPARRPELLRNQVLVGATLAILIVAGTINALMYVLSLYFQDPAAFGMSALEAGLATLPAAAAMIAITPLITPLAVKIGTRLRHRRRLRARRGRLRRRWPSSSRPGRTRAFVLPLVVLAAGLGLANGPASSASTAAVSPDEVGAGVRDLEHGPLHRRLAGRGCCRRRSSTRSRSTRPSPARRQPTRSPPGSRRPRSSWRSPRDSGIAIALLMARHRAVSPTESTAPRRPRPSRTRSRLARRDGSLQPSRLHGKTRRAKGRPSRICNERLEDAVVATTTSALVGLEPQSFWEHFEAITKIARPSRHEEAMIDHVRTWADAARLRVAQDSGRNLVIHVPATSGRESAPIIVLQGHLDMVCERDPDSPNDPTEGRSS